MHRRRRATPTRPEPARPAPRAPRKPRRAGWSSIRGDRQGFRPVDGPPSTSSPETRVRQQPRPHRRRGGETGSEPSSVRRDTHQYVAGPTGVGKTHLAISLAITAAEAGRRVYYGTLAGLIDSLTDAKTAGNLSHRLQACSPIPALLVVDEIGYLPVNQDGAVLFFQLINARHERASTVLTSNKGFEEWGGVLGDEVMAAALIDRLVHHCHIVNIRGNSYRMRDHQNLLQAGSDRRRKKDGS